MKKSLLLLGFFISSLFFASAQAPFVSFLATPVSGSASLVVSFTNTSSANSDSIKWSFPGGTPSSSTVQKPVVTYNTPGVYSISLTATNSFGQNTGTQTNLITVTAPANPCAGFGPFTVSPITVNATGNYTVTITGPNSCTATATTAVTVNCPPSNPTGDYIFAETGNWSPLGSGATVCLGDTTTLTATEGTAQSRTYLWSPGNVPTKFRHFYATQVGIFPIICQVTTPGNWPNPNTTNTYYFTVEVVDCPEPVPVTEPGGINDKKIGLDIFPNPIPNNFTAKIRNFSGDVSFDLYNFLGQLVSHEVRDCTDNLEMQFDLSGLSSGMYTLHITAGDQSVAESILKQ